MKNRPFFLLSILAMLVLLLIGKLMNSKVADAKVVTPECYRTPIMALEFSQDAAMINTIFKLPEPDSLVRVSKTKRFVSATDLDYLYILAYALFMLLFALQCNYFWKKGFIWAILLTLLAALSDVMENAQLMKIFKLVAAGETDYSGIFETLRFWTALKFFSIGAFFLALAPFFWRSNWLGKVVVTTAALALGCWAMACFYQPEFWADVLFGMIFLLFAGAILLGLTFKTKPSSN